jgi:hypothetical protein
MSGMKPYKELIMSVTWGLIITTDRSAEVMLETD